MAKDTEAELKEAEQALAFTEQNFGPKHPMVATRLEHIARLLRESKRRLLDAANMEARAKVIRSQHQADLFNEERLEITQVSEAKLPQTTDPVESITDYQLLSSVGEGGMGKVFKAKHASIDKELAVKLLHPDLVDNEILKKRFEQELKAACTLTHPNLVAVYDFGMTKQGAPYLVMDFIDGVSLGAEIHALGSIQPARALEIFIQVVEAVQHAHDKGILHRDLKPSNIMLGQSGDVADLVKVVDFGIAKLLPGSGNEGKTITATGDVLGSPCYMSPEQCLGERVNERSDIYSMGCVMYETLTGKPPFEGANPIQTIFKHLNEDRGTLVRRLNKLKIPSGLQIIVLQCLRKRPSDRYPSMKELLKDLVLVRHGHLPRRRLMYEEVKWMILSAAIVLCCCVGSWLLIKEQVGPTRTSQVEKQGHFHRDFRPTLVKLLYPDGVFSPDGEPKSSTFCGTLSAEEMAQSPQIGQSGETINVTGNESYLLTPGDHTVSSIFLSDNGSITLAGPARILISDVPGNDSPIRMLGDSSINLSGDPGDLEIWYKGKGKLTLDDNSKIKGAVYAPYASIVTMGSSQVIPPDVEYYEEKMGEQGQTSAGSPPDSPDSPAEKYTEYINEVRERISQQWIRVGHASNGFVWVNVDVNSDGSTSVSSSNMGNDEMALKAVELASPFPPLPRFVGLHKRFKVQFEGDSVTVL